MSFAAAFYNFTIDLNHVDRELFSKFRVKVALHPDESLEHLFARMIAFLHAHQEGLAFSQGLFDIKAPTMWSKDITGELITWVQVGVPERKKLETALRAGQSPEYHVYFYEPEQIRAFCQQLRGSKSNWVEPIQFYSIDPLLLDSLVPLIRSSPEWNITFVDSHIYLTCDGVELESDILSVDIWSAYQDSLVEELPAV